MSSNATPRFDRKRPIALEALRVIRGFGLFDKISTHMHLGVTARFIGLDGKTFLATSFDCEERKSQLRIVFPTDRRHSFEQRVTATISTAWAEVTPTDAGGYPR